MEGYTCSAPIDCTKPFNTSNLKGQTAIVTGGKQSLLSYHNTQHTTPNMYVGANGIGEAYVQALSAAGYVTPNTSHDKSKLNIIKPVLMYASVTWTLKEALN